MTIHHDIRSSGGGEERGITAVIPAFNRAELLDRAIRSVLAQTVPPESIIVVDDGSTDRTSEVAARFPGVVRYLYQDNAGAAAARNHGTREANSPWVAFLDSDDLWLPDHIERIDRAILETSGSADLYFDDMQHAVHGGMESRWTRSGFSVEGSWSVCADATAWVLMDHQPMMLQTSVVRRESYLQIGGIWEELRTAHDTHFFLRLGIGRPACAVAGFGAVQTEDDQPGNRLTTRSGMVKLGRWLNTALLFQDILDNAGSLDASQRGILRRRICEARWRASRMLWEQRDVWDSLIQGFRAVGSDPGHFCEIVARNLRVHSDEAGKRRSAL